MNDQELMTAVRQSVRDVHMDVPAEQILSRSRAIRASGHRRLAACVTAVAAAGSVALGLGLSGALGAAPNAVTGTIRTTAFTLTHNVNGTDTLTLTQTQMFDPVVLQKALQEDGVPALVKINAHCSSNPSPGWPRVLGVLYFQLPDGTPVPGPTQPNHPTPVPADAVIVINPSAIPTGTELFIGYFDSNHDISADLIDTSAYTCTTR
jgi:hypothetical protein